MSNDKELKHGTVVHFDPKGYGHISSPPDQHLYFFHYSRLKDAATVEKIQKGMQVRFRESSLKVQEPDLCEKSYIADYVELAEDYYLDWEQKPKFPGPPVPEEKPQKITRLSDVQYVLPFHELLLEKGFKQIQGQIGGPELTSWLSKLEDKLKYGLSDYGSELLGILTKTTKLPHPSRGLIVNASHNGVIGVKGKIPWFYPEDLKYFRSVTEGHVVLMGRKTWESLGCQPLPNRKNYILSSSSTATLTYSNNMILFPKLDGALGYYEKTDLPKEKRLWVIGGAAIYELALKIDLVDFIDEIQNPSTIICDGTTYFPLDLFSKQRNNGEWELLFERPFAQDDRLTHRRWIRMGWLEAHGKLAREDVLGV